MEGISKVIEVDLPVSTVYNQWTQFEEFPKFMSGLTEVKQLDHKRLHFKEQVAGRTEEWDAEITEQIPDERIAWRSVSGAKNAGLVQFDKLSGGKTQVRLEIFYEPEGIAEKIADALGIVAARTEGDLMRFKEFIESRGVETGSWRGEIEGGEVKHEAQQDAGPDVTGVMLHGATPAGIEPLTRRTNEEDEIAPEP